MLGSGIRDHIPQMAVCNFLLASPGARRREYCQLRSGVPAAPGKMARTHGDSLARFFGVWLCSLVEKKFWEGEGINGCSLIHKVSYLPITSKSAKKCQLSEVNKDRRASYCYTYWAGIRGHSIPCYQDGLQTGRSPNFQKWCFWKERSGSKSDRWDKLTGCLEASI